MTSAKIQGARFQETIRAGGTFRRRRGPGFNFTCLDMAFDPVLCQSATSCKVEAKAMPDVRGDLPHSAPARPTNSIGFAKFDQAPKQPATATQLFFFSNATVLPVQGFSLLQNITKEEEKLCGSNKEKAGLLLWEKKQVLAAINDRKFKLWFLIFLETIEFPIHPSHDPDYFSWWIFHSTDNPMWSLQYVLKQWRMVVMSSPQLWSYINIILTDNNFDDPSYVWQFSEQCSCA
ncbi:hypothetical protein EDD18DRAFT_1113310 [Armillaria luteobubalina]|uniref:Uncharacterized protein n=1 Tax=Armillaria luteobubalina TaxID=153913 RepID=A0AA39PCT5_9AGAR|nr:hypothetical protein EDD18DRAFT_1113310 [Armillaria luteobubalina]